VSIETKFISYLSKMMILINIELMSIGTNDNNRVIDGYLIERHIYSQTRVKSLSNPWSRTGVAENRQHPR